MIYIFIIALVFSALLTAATWVIAKKYRLAILPIRPRDEHKLPTPRLGGLAIGLSLLIIIIGLWKFGYIDYLPKHFWGIIIASLILLITGLMDDFWSLKPGYKFLAQILAVLVVIASGVGISYLRLPFGEHINLETIKFTVITIQGIPYYITLWSDLFIMVWILVIINTLNWLDGLDGLATGITAITGLVIFAMALSLGQNSTALISLVLVATCLGFLPWNFNRAKIFLGDAGSMFLGFWLAILSLISGGKVATAFLVLGIPLFDVFWVILRRAFSGQSIWRPDKKHLHHRLISVGLNQKQAVVGFWAIAAIFGYVALRLGTQSKFIVLIILLILIIAIAFSLVILEKRRKHGS